VTVPLGIPLRIPRIPAVNRYVMPTFNESAPDFFDGGFEPPIGGWYSADAHHHYSEGRLAR